MVEAEALSGFGFQISIFSMEPVWGKMDFVLRKF